MYCPGKEDRICPGDFLFSEYSLYVVDAFLEHGAFATVVKCTRVNDDETVAIKMIKNSRCLETFMEVGIQILLSVKYCVCEYNTIGHIGGKYFD